MLPNKPKTAPDRPKPLPGPDLRRPSLRLLIVPRSSFLPAPPRSCPFPCRLQPRKRRRETNPGPLPAPRPLTPAAGPTMPEKQKCETKPTPGPPPRPLTRAAGPTMPERQKDETKPTPGPAPRPLTRPAGRTMPGRQKHETKPTARPGMPEQDYAKCSDNKYLQPHTPAPQRQSARLPRLGKRTRPLSPSGPASLLTPVSPADGRCVWLFGVDGAMEPREEGRQD